METNLKAIFLKWNKNRSILVNKHLDLRNVNRWKEKIYTRNKL